MNKPVSLDSPMVANWKFDPGPVSIQSEGFTESLREFIEQGEALIDAINTLLEPNADGDSPEHNA